jgi:hypothetical protein
MINFSTPIMSLFVCLLFTVVSSDTRAEDFFSRGNTYEKFVVVIKQNLREANSEVEPFNTGMYEAQFKSQAVAFVPIGHIHPGQLRFSYNNVVDKLTSEGKKFAIFPPEGVAGDPTLNPKNDGGKSFYPESEALHVVLTDFGLVLLDGHHGTLTAIFFGAKTVPVKIVEDLTGKAASTVWPDLESRGKAHLRSLSGELKFPPSSFGELENDILRYFTALVAYKYLVISPTDIEVTPSKSANLWIKINNSIPFIEFSLSDILYRSGFGVKVTKETIAKKPMDSNIVEEARSILLTARSAGHHPFLQHIDLFKDQAEADEVISQVKAVKPTEKSKEATNVAEYLKSGSTP